MYKSNKQGRNSKDQKNCKPEFGKAAKQDIRDKREYDTDVKAQGSRRGKTNTKKPQDEGRKPYNDIAWYSRIPRLVLDSCNIPYGMPSGISYKMGYEIPEDLRTIGEATFENGGDVRLDLPTILVEYAVCSIGYSEDNSSAINIASRNLYSWVRHANSGSANYDSPDMMLYIMAVKEVYSLIADMQRLYGSLNIASAYNRSIPMGVVKAEGYDFSDFGSKINTFRTWLNNYIVRAGALCVPNSFTLFNRDFWTFSNIWIDNSSPKSSLYLYVPYGFRQYEEHEGAGSLQFRILHAPGSTITFNELQAYAEDMLQRLIQSEDIGIMSGDILKAFGENNLFKLGTIPEDYVCLPQESLSALEQIKNTRFYMPVGVPNAALNVRLAHFDIEQDAITGAIVTTQPLTFDFSNMDNEGIRQIVANVLAASGRRMLTTLNPNPTTETTMENTRNMCGTWHVSKESEEVCKVWIPVQPTTLVVFQACFSGVNGDYTPLNNFVYQTLIGEEGRMDVHNVYYTDLVEKINHFRFHPAYTVGTCYADESETFTSFNFQKIFDVDNFSIFNEDALAAIHNAALVSMFAVPELGLFQ